MNSIFFGGNFFWGYDDDIFVLGLVFTHFWLIFFVEEFMLKRNSEKLLFT
jgi:hypothetical protein